MFTISATLPFDNVARMNLRLRRVRPSTVSGHPSRRCQARLRWSTSASPRPAISNSFNSSTRFSRCRSSSLAHGRSPLRTLAIRRLVARPPSVGEGVPVLVVASRPEKRLRLAGNAVAPIHHRTEHVECQGLYVGKRHRLGSSSLSACGRDRQPADDTMPLDQLCHEPRLLRLLDKVAQERRTRGVFPPCRPPAARR